MIEPEVAEYKKHWRERAEREAARRRSLAAQARDEARKVAQRLVREFDADRVYLFGSLAEDGRFHERSDVDLAVEGVPPERFFRVWAAVNSSSSFPIELVDLGEVGDMDSPCAGRQCTLLAAFDEAYQALVADVRQFVAFLKEMAKED